MQHLWAMQRFGVTWCKVNWNDSDIWYIHGSDLILEHSLRCFILILLKISNICLRICCHFQACVHLSMFSVPRQSHPPKWRCPSHALAHPGRDDAYWKLLCPTEICDQITKQVDYGMMVYASTCIDAERLNELIQGLTSAWAREWHTATHGTMDCASKSQTK